MWDISSIFNNITENYTIAIYLIALKESLIKKAIATYARASLRAVLAAR